MIMILTVASTIGLGVTFSVNDIIRRRIIIIILMQLNLYFSPKLLDSND